MIVDFASGRISFSRFVRVGPSGPIDADPTDPPPGRWRARVSTDQKQLAEQYLSLQSPNVTFAAACLKMIRVGKIGRLGWINVIIESERSYTYADRTVIKEWVSGLPTWDGETGNTPPFYFDAYFNVKPSGILDPEEQAFPFNDAPNMPPSYGVKEFEGIPLGKFNIGNDISPIYMERIDGRDKYLACFTLFRGGASKKYKVAWAVRWEVKFGATIECDANKKPIVKLDPDALTRVNLRTVGDPKTVVSKVLGKSPSAELKMYERHKA